MWRDETYTLNDLYDLAHEIGFFHCTLTTNGQQPFGDTRADFVWVSVDGNQACHDLVRGKGTFQVLDRNIRKSGLKNVAINMVIHKNNVSSVTETIRYARENPAVCAISLNFLTPYPGTEELLLPWETRKKVIDHIIKMKKTGYPIINSCSGLKRMKERKTHHNCWISHFILLDGTWKECPGKELGICMDCGFSMAGEMDGVAGLRPDTILAGLKLRNSWWKNRKKKKNTGRENRDERNGADWSDYGARAGADREKDETDRAGSLKRQTQRDDGERGAGGAGKNAAPSDAYLKRLSH